MPEKVDEIHKALVKKGYSEKRSWAIAWSQYNKMHPVSASKRNRAYKRRSRRR